MKKQFFMLGMLLLTALASHADNGDTLRLFRYELRNQTGSVRISKRSTVTIVNDTVAYLEFANPMVTEADRKGVELGWLFQNTPTFTIACPAGTPRMILHLDMSHAVNIHTEGYASVVVANPGRTQSVDIKAEDYSQVKFVNNGDAADTLEAHKIVVECENYASVLFEVPCRAWEYCLTANDYGHIVNVNCQGSSYTAKQNDYSKIELGNPSTDLPLYAFTSGRSEVQRAVRTTTRGYRTVMRLDYLFGHTNWGTTPFNGLGGMSDPYTLDPGFTSHQLEFSYFPYVAHGVALGVGLGYESDVYRLADDYATLDHDPSGIATFAPSVPPLADATDTWSSSSKMVARYVTLPLSVRVMPVKKSSFFVGLAAIPGVGFNNSHTGLKHKGYINKDKFQNQESLSKYMNPFKFDARLSVGWSWLYAYMQVSTLPLMQGMTQELYPVKLGLSISLGDQIN